MELCRGHYSVQCFSDNDSGVPYSVLISANGSHRTTGYRVFLEREQASDAMPSFTFCHERADQPDLQMMTDFQATLAFESQTPVLKVKIRDATGVQTVVIHNLPTLIATCPA